MELGRTPHVTGSGADELNKLEREGWELVSTPAVLISMYHTVAGEGACTSTLQCILKRPVA